MLDLTKTIHFSQNTFVLTSASVDLWLLDLSQLPAAVFETCSDFLSPDEIARAKQFKHRANHFIATRALLRCALSRYANVSVQDLLFARSEHGKPFLSDSDSSIYFNLSHCDDLAVLAVSARGELGVDIEIAGERDYLKIAKRYFHVDEIQALSACSETERKNLFYKLWTLKEAFFKATGGGISSGLDKVFFEFTSNHINAQFHAALNTQANEWQFHQELITADTWMAMALNSSEPLQHQWLNGNSLLTGV